MSRINTDCTIQALPILKAAWDRGINTIDTANMYSSGESERIVGAFMNKVLCRSFSSARSPEP